MRRSAEAPTVRGRDGLLVEPAGPVRRPHQRPGQHAGEAQSLGELRELDELLGP